MTRAHQPGSVPFSVPEQEPNPAAVPRRKEQEPSPRLPVKTPEKVPEPVR